MNRNPGRDRSVVSFCVSNVTKWVLQRRSMQWSRERLPFFACFLVRTGNEERTRFEWENNILDLTAAVVTHGIIK